MERFVLSRTWGEEEKGIAKPHLSIHLAILSYANCNRGGKLRCASPRNRNSRETQAWIMFLLAHASSLVFLPSGKLPVLKSWLGPSGLFQIFLSRSLRSRERLNIGEGHGEFPIANRLAVMTAAWFDYPIYVQPENDEDFKGTDMTSRLRCIAMLDREDILFLDLRYSHS